MTEKLISLKEAAELLGITYSGIRNIRANNVDIFPAEAAKGLKGSPLYKESDFLPLKEQFGKVVIRKLDNNFALLFLTGRTAEIAGDYHAH